MLPRVLKSLPFEARLHQCWRRYFGHSVYVGVSGKKVKSNYFIVRPKVDQRAGLLSLPHLGIFAIHTR